MRYATFILTAVVAGNIAVVACSASGDRNETTGSQGAGGNGASGGGSGAGGSSSSTSGGGEGTSSGGGMATTSSSGSSSGASSGASSGMSSSGSGTIDFDGGWQIPDSGMQPPPIGDGGTGVIIGPGADGTSPGKFGGTDNPNAKPNIVYPPDGVVVPPNMHSIEFHFIPAAGQTLFEVTFHAPSTNLTIYTGCTALNGGCVFTPDDTFWASLVEFARGTASVTYTIRGVNGQSPGQVGTSATRTIAFGQQDIKGGIYYWNSGGTIQRYDFGYPSVPAKQYINAPEAGAFACVGCHVLSRDGDRMLLGKDIPAPAPYTLYNVATKTPINANGQPLTGSSNFFSFAPDGKYFLQSDGISISMRRVVDGNILVQNVALPGTMPDWSPDGLHVVYAKPKNAPFFAMPGVDSASLETLHWNGTAWDSPKTLVPFNGENNYYPTYAPTGEWVLFNRSPGNHESFSNAKPDPDAGTLPDGELWVVSSNGGAPIRLAKATNPGATQWPKWAPVQNNYYGGKILWVTFSSARAYGLRLADGDQTQIWMMGFDPQKAAAGQDPSLPAFWFPYQSLSSGNHIAQWATKVERKPCAQDIECAAGETCKGGHCVPIP